MYVYVWIYLHKEKLFRSLSSTLWKKQQFVNSFWFTEMKIERTNEQQQQQKEPGKYSRQFSQNVGWKNKRTKKNVQNIIQTKIICRALCALCIALIGCKPTKYAAINWLNIERVELFCSFF